MQLYVCVYAYTLATLFTKMNPELIYHNALEFIVHQLIYVYMYPAFRNIV